MRLKLAVIVFAAVVLMQARAGAESLAVLDVYVLPSIPIDYLKGVVEPQGDDIFAAERRGLSLTLQRLVHGIVNQHSDYTVKKLVNPAVLSVNPERVFLYYLNSEKPEDYYDRTLLLQIAGELGADVVLVGTVRELEIKRPSNGPEWVRMKISFSLYDAAEDTFIFTQTYEQNTDGVTGYVDPEGIPRIQGRLPSDIKIFIENEAGRVFMSIAEVFVSDLTSADVGTYLSDSYKVEGNIGYVDANGYDIAPAGAEQAADMNEAVCRDTGQAMAVAVPVTGAGVKLFACFDGKYDMTFPDASTRALVPSPQGLASLSAGDFDGDGIDELVVSSASPGETVRVFWMKKRLVNMDDFVEAKQLIPTPGVDVGVNAAAGDFDGDGADELAVTAATKLDYTLVYDFADGEFKTGTPLITFKEVIGSSPNGSFIAAGDFDGDGADDLAIASNGAGEKVKVFSLPSGQRTRPMLLGDLSGFFDGKSTAVSVAAGDFNGDGKDELVVSSMDNGVKVKVLAYSAGGFDLDNPLANIRTDANASKNGARVATGDIDGDGDADLVVSVIGNAKPELWIFRFVEGAFDLGTPYIGTSAIFPSAPNGMLVTVGKFE